jgi:hypothetical protein
MRGQVVIDEEKRGAIGGGGVSAASQRSLQKSSVDL